MMLNLAGILRSSAYRIVHTVVSIHVTLIILKKKKSIESNLQYIGPLTRNFIDQISFQVFKGIIHPEKGGGVRLTLV
jgi:hypothetical protein